MKTMTTTNKEVIAEMQGWKVIKPDRSSCVEIAFALIYPPDVEVFPILEGSKIFFFKEKADADMFRGRSGKIVVPCIAKNAVKATVAALYQNSTIPFWKKYNVLLNNAPLADINGIFWSEEGFYVMNLPNGTYFAESITCLE